MDTISSKSAKSEIFINIIVIIFGYKRHKPESRSEGLNLIPVGPSAAASL